MLTILTIPDLIKFLMSQCAWFIMALWRSRHSTLMILVTTCLVTMALTVFLTYRCVQISKLRNPYIVDDLSYQSKDLYNQLSNSNTRLSLLGQMPPITVHYMWCRKSHFEYKHYLSLLSVAKVLLPDQIVFHYLEMPQTDRKGYFTWFDDIQREVAMLSLKQIHNARHCSHDFSKGVPKSDDFPSADGVFMMEDIAITNLSRDAFYHHTGAKKLSGSVCEDLDGKVCENVDRTPAQLFLLPASEPYSLVPGQGRAIFECPNIDAFNKANISTCLQLSQRLFPSDLWQRNKTFERFARRIAFNNPDAVSPVPNPALAAPSIAHILKFDGEAGLSPLCYASIRSAFTQGKLQHVFVHGVLEKEKDSLWNALAGKFSVTHVPTPSMEASSSTRQQLLYGMHVLIQYGGILLTCDTIIQKPVDPLLHYPSVSTVQKSIYRIIHHHIDFSILAARPGSGYLQSLIPVLKQMIETDSERDIGAVAYHVLEQYPSSVHLDLNLVGHLTCKAKRCLPKEGQLDVRQAYAVTISWTEGGPPTSLEELEQLSTPLVSLT